MKSVLGALIVVTTAALSGVLGEVRIGASGESLKSLPSIPLINVEPWHHWHLMGYNSTGCESVKDWYGRDKQVAGLVRVDGQAFRLLGGCNSTSEGKHLRPFRQSRVYVGCTLTELDLEAPDGTVKVTMQFTSSQIATDLKLLSRPVWHVSLVVKSLDGKPHAVQVYLDASAEHATNGAQDKVQFEPWQHATMEGLRVGTVAQKVLGRKGDKVHIDWGYFYIGVNSDSGHLARQYYKNINMQEQRRLGKVDQWIRGGGAEKNRNSFATTGTLPQSKDYHQKQAQSVGEPRSKDLVVLSIAKDLGQVLPDHGKQFLVSFAYDDVDSVLYYGKRFKGYWTQFYTNITEAILAAHREFPSTFRKGQDLDRRQDAEALRVSGGSQKYADLARIAYRSTLGALKIVWNHEKKGPWSFLKEISTNGDMNTVDVIYPASPMLLYYNPTLLLQTMMPVLSFANNENRKKYWWSYSPHEIGVFPIADHGTLVQEPMPMENSGNSLLMLLGIFQRSSSQDATKEALYPAYWPLLTRWADNLVKTLPFPMTQLCTDDFNGLLGNNTNLAAKAIVGLEAFAELCRAFGAPNCEHYSSAAKEYADTWVRLAVVRNPSTHSLLAYGKEGTWSTKYNLVWQRLLNLGDGRPFPTSLLRNESAFYVSQTKRYGTPLDSRNDNVKLDWLSWAAALDSQESFESIMAPLYAFIEETQDQSPMPDLYNAVKGTNPQLWNHGFVDRPVLGGVFARLLLIK